MSIVDQKATYELVDLYNKLKTAQDYAAQWAAQVVALTAQIKALPVYVSDASPDEKMFVDTASAINDSFSKDVPKPPDAVVVLSLPDLG